MNLKTSMTDNQELRQQINESLERGLWAKAHTALAELWRQQPTPSIAAYAVSRYEHLRAHLPMVACRLALLRPSCSSDWSIP